jgi:outer membrane protein assembly factor BamC
VYVVSVERPAGSTAEPAFPSTSATPAPTRCWSTKCCQHEPHAEKGGSVSLLAARFRRRAVSLSEDGSGNPVLYLGSDLDRAWSGVGRALEQGEWRVEDINRSLGLYYINLAEKPDDKQNQPGFQPSVRQRADQGRA